MKATWVINGKVQLILTPSNEREKALLEELCQAPVDMHMHDKLQTGQDSHINAVVITTKTS